MEIQIDKLNKVIRPHERACAIDVQDISDKVDELIEKLQSYAIDSPEISEEITLQIESLGSMMSKLLSNNSYLTANVETLLTTVAIQSGEINILKQLIKQTDADPTKIAFILGESLLGGDKVLMAH